MTIKKKRINKTQNKTQAIVILLILIAVVLLIAITQKKETKITGFTILSLQSFPQNVTLGSRLKLDIIADDVNDLAGVQIDVNYDPNVLRYNKTVEGNFLNRGSALTLMLDTIDASAPGVIKGIVIVRINGGTSGNGVIASIYFDAIGTGLANLNFGQVLLANSSGNAINTSTVNTNITVTEISPPALAIVSPAAGSLISGSSVDVVYRALGDLSEVDHAHLQLDNNTEFHDLDFDGLHQFTSVASGEHILKGYLARENHEKIGSNVVVSFRTTLVNNPPIVTYITTDIADVDSAKPGIQFFENTTVTYSANASDPDNDQLSWIWLYSIDNGSNATFALGTDSIQPAAFNYPPGTAGITYRWTIRVSDGKATRESSLNVGITAEQCVDHDKDGYGPGCNLTNDCDQSNPNINPGSDENCATPFDDNCNGLVNCDDSACINHTLCRLDTDEDSIPDGNDRCPYTKPKHKNKVNIYGCPMPNANKFSLYLTTNFSSVDLRNVTDLRIGIENRGQILYGKKGITLLENDSEPIDLDKFFEFLHHKVIVYTHLFTQLNASATITLINMTNITNPVIKRDNATCSDCLIISFKNGNLTFTVPHFTEYSVEEGSYCGDDFCSSQESCSGCSADCGSCSPSSTSGGSTDGGGGGAGGGRGIAFYVCDLDWQCSEWSICINSLKTRNCELVKVPLYAKNTKCPNLDKPPITSQRCEMPRQPQPIEEIAQNQTEIEPALEYPAQIEPETLEEKPNALFKKFLLGFGIGLMMAVIVISIITYMKAIRYTKTASALGIDKKTLEEIVSYTNSMRRLGKNDEEITESLSKIGWDKNVIESLLRKKFR